MANALSVEDVVLLNSTASASTGTAARVLFPALSFTMGDLFSLSVLQILSVLSFLTSILAVVRVGTVSLHRFSPKFEAHINQPEMNVARDTKAPLWSWSLGGSLSLGSLIGEEEEEEAGTGRGYTGGSDLVRMDWQVARPVSSASRFRLALWPADVLDRLLVQLPPQYSQPPISMAKLIMSRHVRSCSVFSTVTPPFSQASPLSQLQRKPSRQTRRLSGSPRSTTPSRLTQSAV